MDMFMQDEIAAESPPVGGQLLRRATVREICQQRDRALELYAAAHRALVAADLAIRAARIEGQAAATRSNRYNQHLSEDKAHFHQGIPALPKFEDYQATARKIVDTDVWAHLIISTDLEQMMDKKAKDEFYQALLTDPPEATEETVFATMSQMMCDADLIFKRGIANCFTNLDRRFRSHDGWKIGSRVILSYMFNEYGSWNYHRNERDTLQDIERTFFVLDGRQPPPNYGGIVGALEEARRGGSGRRQSEIESEFFKVRAFKNGNGHVWFKRDDLVDKVNRLLGDYYDSPIPEERSPAAADPFTAKTSLAKNYGFYPSPEPVVSRVADLCPLYVERGAERLTVLEPSAGTGNLARAAVAKGGIVDCVEYQAELAEQLRASGLYRDVRRGDFLAIEPTPIYDRVIMNPPFDRERDIDHVMHALKFLKPDGHLTAVMSAGTEFRETRKSVAFRELVEGMGAEWTDLPAGSFASVGTYCNTRVLSVWKSGRRSRW